ncbi:DUF4232 domain-containing protein [Kitasatospora viridis]|uniref:Uncharacterized protein DUF4232 n=1 Tax=Kitasatospora viridis TaxID=281105 RepID=A0A561UC90_9ACTN|nr:DUF4232 domain-containing protein [Kitasatospora viridis]TWF96978.1 uncharacterized protein DUF4232 [Kitasatospora viridis]
MYRIENRPRPLAAAITVAVAGLLLAGCDGEAAAPSAASPGACGVPSATPAPARDGVRITAVGPGCAQYEVTNPDTEPADVAVLFTQFSPSGGAIGNLPRTVTAVPAGATVRGQVELDRSTPDRTHLKVVKVRRVPTAEAPAPGGPCPASGVRVYADDEPDAAMGLRAVGLHLRNCGTATVNVNGYPQLQLLDADHRQVDGIDVLRGGAAIATGTGADTPPAPIALHPGEGAVATLVWRNTTTDGTPVNAPYVRVRAFAGAAPVMVTPELDLGTTGRLGAGAWVREAAQP